jgi:hypothetical protein
MGSDRAGFKAAIAGQQANGLLALLATGFTGYWQAGQI